MAVFAAFNADAGTVTEHATLEEARAAAQAIAAPVSKRCNEVADADGTFTIGFRRELIAAFGEREAIREAFGV